MLTQHKIPKSVVEACGDAGFTVSCSGSVTSLKPNGVSVVYPVAPSEPPNSKPFIPLAGGALINISFSSLGVKSITAQQSEYLFRKMESTSSEGKVPSIGSLKELVAFRNAINNDLVNLSRKRITYVDRDMPSVYLTSKLSDESSGNRICELNYIPYEALKRIASRISEASSVDFLAGFSGYGLSEFINLPDSLSTANVFAFEFLPSFKIESETIVGLDEVIVGGYFTYYDNKIIIKMPDLTGEDSAGFINNSLWKNRTLSVELEKDALDLEVIDFSEFNIEIKPKLSVEIKDPEFKKIGNEYTLKISSSLDSTDSEDLINYSVYLSPTYENLSTRLAGFKAKSPFVDIVSAPLLTKPFSDFSQDPKATYSKKLSRTDAKASFLVELNSYSPNQEAGSYYSDSLEIINDFTLYNKTEYETNLGEQNSPEVVLCGRGFTEGLDYNENKFYSQKIMAGSKLIATSRPRIFEKELFPSFWIKSSKIEKEGAEYVVHFPVSEFERIFSKLGTSDINFAVYFHDLFKQTFRATRGVTLYSDSPSISKITPDGFANESGVGVQILKTQKLKLEISGENLFQGTYLSFTREDDPITVINIVNGTSGTTITYGLSDGFKTLNVNSESTLESLGFINETPGNPNGASYFVEAVLENGKRSGKSVKIFISKDASITIPLRAAAPLIIQKDSLYGINFGRNSEIHSIPLITDGKSRALIDLKSKKGVFLPDIDSKIFCYLAIPESGISGYLTTPDKIFSTNISYLGSSISVNVISDYSASVSGDAKSDFYYKDKKQCFLRFPFDSFKNKNVSALSGLSEAYLLFTNFKITTSLSSMPADSYSVIRLGDSSDRDKPPFILPPYILSFAGRSDGQEELSFVGSSSTKDFHDEAYSGSKVANSPTSFFNNIKDLSVCFIGAKEKNLKQKYSFFIGEKDITPNLRTLKYKKSGQILAKFKNIEITNTGSQPLYVSKMDEVFGCSYASDYSYSQESIYLDKAQSPVITLPDPPGTLTINLDSIDNVNRPPNNGGRSFLFKPRSGSSSVYQAIDSLNRLTIGVSSDLIFFDSIFYYPFVLQEVLTAGGSKPYGAHDVFSNIEILNSSNEIITSIDGSFFNSNILHLNGKSISLDSSQYTNGEKYVIAFLHARIKSPALLSLNVAEALGIGVGPNASNFENSLTGQISTNALYSIKVRSPESIFTVIINEITIKPESITSIGANLYSATIRIPEQLAGAQFSIENCLIICASSANTPYLKASDRLGQNFINNLEQNISDLIGHVTSAGAVDIQKIWDPISEFFLSFGGAIYDNAPVAADAVQDFCDASFYLTSEFNLSLKGYQTLLIPIQTIFNIIDVICSLLNPTRLAQAIVRLFQSLYDLLALLPQISVPISVIKLLAHLIQVVDCLAERVLFITNVINQIIEAFNTDTTNNPGLAEAYNTTLALELILNEYLFKLDASIEVLRPITAILGTFLDLLKVVVNFPCSIDAGSGDLACGIDGSILAGIVSGVMSVTETNPVTQAREVKIKPEALIPVAQSYTNDQPEDAPGGSAIIDPTPGELVVTKTSDKNFIESMAVDPVTLRATSNFPATFAISATKMKKAGGGPRSVKLKFKERGRSNIFGGKIIDPDFPLDSKISLLSLSSDKKSLSIHPNSSTKGNFYSPIDGAPFINITDPGSLSSSKGSVLPLVLTFDVPIYDVDQVTGETVQIATETITRTFFDIPSMALVDEEFNLYFIDQDGISFDSDGNIDEISAKIINGQSAKKLKLSTEEEPYDSNGDGIIDASDDVMKIIEFPNFYFFDMRQASDQIQQYCQTSSINNFLLQTENPSDIISGAKDCVDALIEKVKTASSDVKKSLANGVVPTKIDVAGMNNVIENTRVCVTNALDDMCPFVVNSLNTSFKVLEDDSFIPKTDFPDFDIPAETIQTFEVGTAALTGAREYAAGIGDDAQITTGGIGHIEIIPRDSYDKLITVDLTSKISIDIIEDTTGSASIIPQETNGNFYSTKKNGTSYIGQLTASSLGRVKLRAKICSTAIQAVTYAAAVSSNPQPTSDVDCVPNAANTATTDGFAGALTRVDRIITVYFVRGESIITGIKPEDGILTTPQEFGSSLEN